MWRLLVFLSRPYLFKASGKFAAILAEVYVQACLEGRIGTVEAFTLALTELFGSVTGALTYAEALPTHI
jgi:hypothetical protein